MAKMVGGKIWRWLGGIRRWFCPVVPGTTRDTVRVKLYGLEMEVSREIGNDLPYEVTVVVPRAEIRRRCLGGPKEGCECEMILNSITIAHSPRNESGGKSSIPIVPSQNKGFGAATKRRDQP